jgi:hypothetical protein
MKKLLLVKLLLVGALVTMQAQIIFTDSFNTLDSSDFNADIEARTDGSSLALKWNVHFDTEQNSFYSIEDNMMKYTGPGGTGHPQKVFLVNRNNEVRRNLSDELLGQQYEISFSLMALTTEGTDKIGIILADASNAQNVLTVQQLVSRSQVEVVRGSDPLVRYDEWAAGDKNDIRMFIDETGIDKTYDVYVNDILTESGNITFANDDRFVIMSISDNNRNGTSYIDNFSITVIPEPSAYSLILGLLVGTGAFLRRARRAKDLK